jgi:hypothetical protein
VLPYAKGKLLWTDVAEYEAGEGCTQLAFLGQYSWLSPATLHVLNVCQESLSVLEKVSEEKANPGSCNLSK